MGASISIAIKFRASDCSLQLKITYNSDVHPLDAEASEVPCLGCRQGAPSEGYRTRCWQSTVGPLELTRRYCWCEPCGQGRALAQQQVGLPSGEYTANLEEVCALMATTVPHGMAMG
jgi:hypothetical protein